MVSSIIFIQSLFEPHLIVTSFKVYMNVLLAMPLSSDPNISLTQDVAGQPFMTKYPAL
jgi:hypothetical protein